MGQDCACGMKLLILPGGNLMKNVLKQLWRDQAGAVVSAELVLVATTALLGLLVGQATLRDGVNNELADVAQAIDDLDQSYEISGIDGHSAAVAESEYETDANDFCDQDGTAAEHCIVIVPPTATPDGDDDA